MTIDRLGSWMIGVMCIVLSAELDLSGRLHGQMQTLPPLEPGTPTLPGPELIVPGTLGGYPIAPVVGVPKRILSGRFTADTLIDIVLHDGASAHLVSGVDLWGSGQSATIAASSLVRHRPYESGRDALLGSDAAGLTRWTFEEDGTITALPLGHPAWAGATSLAIGDLGGGPSPDLAGIAVTGEVLVLLDIDAPEPAASWFTTLGAPLDLVLADWDGAGSSEIAVRATTGVRIHSAMGALIVSFRGFHPTGALVRLDRTGGTDRLAWVTPNPTGTAEFLAILQAPETATIAVLGPPGSGAIDAADLDGDGFTDLALRYGAAGDLGILLGDENGYTIGDPERVQLLPGTAGDGPLGAPHFLDLEGDGDPDLLWGADGGARLRTIRSSVIDASLSAPCFDEVRFDTDDVTGAAYLVIVLDNGPDLPAGTTHIEGAVFRQAAPGEPTDPLPLSSLLIPFAEVVPGGGTEPIEGGGTGGAGTPLEFPEPQPTEGDPSPYPAWEVPLPEVGTSFPSVHTIVVRYVELDTEGEVIASGPARVFLFTPETEEEIGTGGTLDAIIALGAWLGWSSTIPDEVVPPGIEPEFSSTGTIIETKPVPDVPPDEEPKFGP